MQTKTDIIENSVDPDETTHNIMSRLIWIYTVCYSVLDLPALLAMVVSTCKDGIPTSETQD